MPKTKEKLSPKQKRFCEEYLVDLNGTQAAIRAGYSEKTAGVIADENLKKPYIKQLIKELQNKLSEKTEITAEKVIQELAKIGFSNVQDYITGDNEIQDISEITPQKAAAVSSIKKSTTTFGSENSSGTKEVVEFKLWDKTDALEKLGRHLGIFQKDNEQSKPNIIKQNVITLADGTTISI